MYSTRLSSSSPTDTKRRLTRAKQLRHLRDCDVKDLNYFLNSPVRHSDVDDSSSSSPSPQPLPLPDLSALFSGADKIVKERRRSKLKQVNFDRFRLPSPTTGVSKAPGINACREVEHDDGRRNVDALHRTGPQRSPDTHRSVHRADTWSSRNVHKKIQGLDQTQMNLRIDINYKSAPSSTNTSPMVSPQRILNGDIFSSYHDKPNRWSEPSMPSGFPFSPSHHDSVHHILPVKHLKPSQKSTSGPSSPRHPKLNIEVSLFHKDGNFLMNGHPLPFPPTPGSFPQVSTRNEYSPVKNQWTKGKLIGRGTFGSVYAATNRETGALCAMKEVELCSEKPKAAAMFKVLKESPLVTDTLSPEGKDFLNCCFCRNPTDRPSACKLLEHSFLKNCQQLDVQISIPPLNSMNLMGKAHSPIETYHNKLNKVPMSPNRWPKNGKGGISETGAPPHPETNDKTKGPRHSPKSILEPVTSLSPPRLGPIPKLLVSLNTSIGMTSAGTERKVFSAKLWA